MPNKILITLLFSFCLHCVLEAQEMTAKMAKFIEEIDGKTFEDIEAELEKSIEGVQAFMAFVQGGSERDTPKTYTKAEERLGTAFKIDTSALAKAMQQFSNMGYSQLFKNHKSFVKFHKIDDDYWHKVTLGEGMEAQFVPKTIYYKDGSVARDSIATYDVSFFWEEDWGAAKVMDSIAIDYTISYVKAYDSLTLSKFTKKLKYKKRKIAIKNLEKNYLYLTVSDAYADALTVRAFNDEGKPLSQNSSSSSPTPGDDIGSNMATVLKFLEDVLAKLKGKAFDDKEAFKSYLLKNMETLKFTEDNDNIQHLKYYFAGAIESVKLYITTEEKVLTVPFTATNTEPFSTVLLMETETDLIFMDAQANEIFRTAQRPLKRIGTRIFLEEETYYYLNTSTKTLDAIKAEKIFESSNGLIFIQRKEAEGFLVFDMNLEQRSDVMFSRLWSVDKTYAHALDNDGDKYYAINTKGQVKKIEGVTEIGRMSEGLLIARQENKYGFINPSGEIIVPIVYSDVKLFQEGVAVVKNEKGLYGYIDTTNQMVLPLKYVSARSFENGIALVSDNDNYYLIDKKGNVVVKAANNGYSINGSGVAKTYSFGNKVYDAFGKPISKR